MVYFHVIFYFGTANTNIIKCTLVQIHGLINHRIEATDYDDPIRGLDHTFTFFQAALIAARMTKHMPPSIFSTIARSARIAVFGHGQDTTIFPEYAALRDTPHCYSEYKKW